MIDRRREVRLTLKALTVALVRSAVRRDHLQRDRSRQRALRRLANDAHASAPRDRLYPAAREGRARTQPFGHMRGL